MTSHKTLIRRITTALVPALLLLGVGFSAHAAPGDPIALTQGEARNTRFGNAYGTNHHKNAVSYTFPGNATDLVAQVHAFNIDPNQVSIYLNGIRLGSLDPRTPGKKYSQHALWWLPKALLRPTRNTLKFKNEKPGTRWGVRRVGVFATGTAEGEFGNLRLIGGDFRNKKRVRLNIPAAANVPGIDARIFNGATTNAVAILVNGAIAKYADTTAQQTWGDLERIPLDPTRKNIVDFIHVANSYQAPRPAHSWGVRFEGLLTQAPPPPPEPSALATLPGLDRVTHERWDETAVRQVLHVFAFGGQASADMIKTWSEMDPGTAITQMLTMDEHNALLSPPEPGDVNNVLSRDGTLGGMIDWFGSADGPVPADDRDRYSLANGHIGQGWVLGTLMRGFNPFRQKMTLWESSYHMAINTGASVRGSQAVQYYDDIAEAYEDGSRYENIIGTAAKSAAIARQYKNNRNLYRRGMCECNEDFAREFYQLFFGILGTDDVAYHETVTIKNMARSLTDMRLFVNPNTGNQNDFVTFGTKYHFPEDVEMLHQTISGTTGSERIDAIAPFAIEHPESLAALPVMVVEGLADDNLSETGKTQLREAWASMASKDMLHFIRNYAVSDLFHSPQRIKHWTSLERNMILGTRITTNNVEAVLDIHSTRSGFRSEDVALFRPRHNVFGDQTGIEAAGTPDVFLQNYNKSTVSFTRQANTGGTKHGVQWSKDWTRVIPSNDNGEYPVRHVAEFLWNYLVTDGLDNFGPLERAQVYSLLATGNNFQYLVDAEDHYRVFTTDEIANDTTLSDTVDALATRMMTFQVSGDVTTEDVTQMQYQVGAAINFINATPFMFIQEGR